jgi:hypothetical protein
MLKKDIPAPTYVEVHGARASSSDDMLWGEGNGAYSRIQ